MADKHRYDTCRDDSCPRLACRAYKDGYADGFTDGATAANASQQ